jgi:hypothetical protein
MAKENTHIFFAHRVLEHFRETELLRNISEYIDYYYLGSVILDTFYYSSTKSIEIISERLHGKDGNPTNEMIFEVLEGSRDMRDIAFILGYITHCALDITFHPIAYYLSGNYYDPVPTKRRHAVYMHRHMETCLDVKLENPLRIYNMIHTPLIHALKFQEIITRDFSISPADIRRTLIKQLLTNRLFESTYAYSLARMIHRLGARNIHEYLGLFYGDILARGETIPDPLTYRDIVTGTKKTTSIKIMMNEATKKAITMMEAAYEFSCGEISKERLIQLIPGESLDTGRLHAPTSTVRYTTSAEPDFKQQ